MSSATYINLWECLTSLERKEERYEKEPLCRKVNPELLMALGRAERFYNQELSLEVTEQGWLIKILTCSVEQYGDSVEILIPKDHREPCQILKDRIGIREYHHA